MNTDQTAAEAWENIAKTFQHFDKVPADTGIAIIKSAIEKAINAYDSELDRIQNGKGLGIIHESRAAHASEPLLKKVIDLAYRVICEHSGECEIENLPNEMQCIVDGAAHTSEQEKWTVCEYDSDTIEICAPKERHIAFLNNDKEGHRNADAIVERHNAKLQQSDDTKRLDWIIASMREAFDKGKIKIPMSREAIDSAMSQTKQKEVK